MKNYVIKIPIIRNNYEKTKSAKFKGEISIVSNEYGVISGWKIKFHSLSIDLYTTESWVINKNTNFKRRKKLFEMLNLKQEIRPPSQKDKKVIRNKLVPLEPDQLKIVEEYFANHYNSTFKNIVAVLKGNNPGGEAAKPSSAEMIINSDLIAKNFVILLDDLTSKYKRDFGALAIGAEEITLKEFIGLNDQLKSAFDFMQRSKDQDSWKSYLINIKKYYKQYNVDLTRAQAIANKARGRFAKNVTHVDKLPFGFVSPKQFQKCHIYEFHDLRDKILVALMENKSTTKYEKMISDPNNFIPLPEMIHRQFDSNVFTYSKDGEITPISEDGVKFIEEFVQDRYKKIPNFFLSDERKRYLEKRNQMVIQTIK